MAVRKKKRPSVDIPATIEGVELESLRLECFNRAYALAAKVEGSPIALPPAKAPIHERVKALVLWYRATTPNNELGGCSQCGGDSDMRLEECPFCGDSEVADGEVDEPVVESSLPVPLKKKKSSPSKSAKKLGNTGVTVAGPLPCPAPLKKKKKPIPSRPTEKLGNTGVTEADPRTIEVVSPEVSEPTEPSAALSKYSTKDLDRAVKAISGFTSRTASSLHSLGVELNKVFTERLWMLRVDASGKRKYKTFKQFCNEELQLSYGHCHRIMTVSKSFSLEEMQEYGVSKCQLLLKVPKENRGALMDISGSESQPTRAQLSDVVKGLTKAERPVAPHKHGKPITVALARGRQEIPLYARPKGREGYPSAIEQAKTPRKALALSDDPFAIEILPNDVRVLYTISQNTDGSWVLVVDRSRVKDSELFPSETGDE